MQSNTRKKEKKTLVQRLAKKKWRKRVENKNEQLEIYIGSPAFALSPICSLFIVNGINQYKVKKEKKKTRIFMVITGREMLRPRSSKPSEASEIQSAKAELVRFLSGSLIRTRGGPRGNYAGLCSLKR